MWWKFSQKGSISGSLDLFIQKHQKIQQN
jgi:hypothetical protein